MLGFLRLIIFFAASILVILSLLGLCGAWAWQFDLLAHFRWHYLGGAALLLVLAALAHHYLPIITAALALVLNFWAMMQVPQAPAADGGGSPLTVATFNILGDNRDIAALNAWLDSALPDLVVFQELSPEMARLIVQARPDYPHRFLMPKSGAFGIGIISRHPLRDADLIVDINARFPLLRAIVEFAGGEILIIGLHPPVPFGANITDIRDHSIAQAAIIAKESARPVIVLGDFNATPWSAPLRHLFASAPLASAMRWPPLSYTSWQPWPLRIPIDHILVGPGFAVESAGLGPAGGSDHFPFVAKLRLQPRQ